MTLLGDELVAARIKSLRERCKTQEDIAAEIGVTQGTVSRILRREGLGGYSLAPRGARVRKGER